LFGDAVRAPLFAPQEWTRVQALEVESLRRDQDNPSAVASLVGMRSYFGTDHPYGRPAGGTPQSVGALLLDDIRGFHRRAYTPSGTTLLVAGDLTLEEAQRELERIFGRWPAAEAKPARIDLRAPQNAAFRVVLVDKPESVQTVIRFYFPGPVYADPNRVKLTLLNTIFGGSFTSRLNQNLREQHGYTYGAGSRYFMDPHLGFLLAYANVQAEVTGEALKEFLKEFASIRSGDIADEEVSKARASFRTDLVQDYENLGAILQSAVTLLRNRRPFDGPAADLKASAVNADELNAVAKDALPLEQGVLVLVGDRQTILDQIQGLGLPKPIELTVTGEPK
jgi:predicted Zn-dependent peptidase